MGDIIIPLIVVAVVVASYVVQLLSKLLQQPGQRPGPNGGPPRQQGPLEDEIGDFLRKASAQRPGQPRRPVRREMPSPEDQPVGADRVESQSGRLRESLAGGRSPQFDSHLGEAVVDSETQLENHLHSSFDHRVGELEPVPGESDPLVETVEALEVTSAEDHASDTPSMAASLAGVFSRPDSIRRAVILQEILQRPEHRWK